jgi:DNA-nicking Smr family endonuclease
MEWENFKKTCNPLVNKGNRLVIKSEYKNIKNVSRDYFFYDEKSDFVLEKCKSLGIDKNLDKKLKGGNLQIDARLDLHGCILENAHNRVYNFIEMAVSNNYRCLLIITGKGLNSNTNDTIKNNLQEWFKEAYFANRVIKYCDAAPKDGGGGAVYVLLKNHINQLNG